MENKISNLEIKYSINEQTASQCITDLIAKASQQANSRLIQVCTSVLLFFIAVSVFYIARTIELYSDNGTVKIAILIITFCVPLNLLVNFNLLNNYRKKVIRDCQKVVSGDVHLILSDDLISWSSDGIQSLITWPKISSVHITPHSIVLTCPLITLLIPTQGHGSVDSNTKENLKQLIRQKVAIFD